jgi:hypothetical protein
MESRAIGAGRSAWLLSDFWKEPSDFRMPEHRRAPGKKHRSFGAPARTVRCRSCARSPPEMRHTVDTAMQAALIDISDHPPKCPRRGVYHEPARRRRDDLATVRLATREEIATRVTFQLRASHVGPTFTTLMRRRRGRCAGKRGANRCPDGLLIAPLDSVTSSFRGALPGRNLRTRPVRVLRQSSCGKSLGKEAE